MGGAGSSSGMNNPTRMTTWAVPRGMRDVLPDRAAARRRAENALAGLMEERGYREVATPAFEYLDVLAREAGEIMERETFRLFDQDGRTLALRPEMTTPVARLAASRMRDEPRPLRLWYVADVFREESEQPGHQRQFRQAGLELIGATGASADAEVVGLMIEALRRIGVDEFTVALGQVEVFRRTLREAGLDQASRREVKRLMELGDIVGVRTLMKEMRLDRRSRARVEGLISFQGGRSDLAKWVGRDLPGRSPAGRLLRTLAALEERGLGNRVMVDLSVVRNFDYYTGLICEAYVPGVGLPVGGGGRYDRLLAEFGMPAPAAGFALSVDRLPC